GSFVLDAFGHRWAMDLGSDNYDLPGYFGQQRFTYYRLRTEGHNTLTIDGQNQPAKAKAAIVAFHSSPDRASAVIDLSEGYAGLAKSVRRGVAMIDRKRVVMQDELELTKPAEVVWSMHTPSKVALSENDAVALLTQDNAGVRVRIAEPAGARFEVGPANGP